ncbi:MAG: hypothetical protein J1E81_06470 [Eubacterium sp.]|nr:hypothetical protein [Eubacterium sp.]
MKRFLIVLLCLVIVPFSAYADEEYDSYIESFDLSAFSELPDEATHLLEDLGIADFDYESISDISLGSIFEHIYNVIVNRANGPLKSGIMIICFVILSSFFKAFSNELYRNDSSFYSTITTLIIAIFLVTRLTDCISICCSTIELCANFAFAFFPVFCVIVATGGGALTSISVNTMLLSLAQGLNAISQIVFIPASNSFLAVSICSSLRNELNLNGVVTFFKKIITMSISVLSAMFVSVLTLKTAVASRTDALGLRSIRFAINTVVPVIGNSISEGLLSIQSYSGLIKTSVGVVGIIAVALIFLPALIEVVLWRGALFVAGLCAGVFDDEASSKVINCFTDMLLIINVILILSMVTTIISIGILIAAKTGV